MLTAERCCTCFRHMVLVAVCILVASLARAGYAQVARMEVIPFESLTLTDQEFLARREDGEHVTIAGELRLPRSGNERFPLVTLLHGSGGVSNYVLDWEQEFLALGVATFVIDSVTARGIISVNDDQSQLGRLAQTEDAYRALALLAKHPRIDSARVMLMGFSRGGQNALYASLTRFQRMHAGAPGAHFAAYVAFYPDCSYTYRDDEDIVSQPVRVFQGTADNYAPVAPCRAYVERLEAKGKDIRLLEYPGASHVFDGRSFKPPVTLRQAQTMRNCQWEEGDNGQIFNAKTNQPFSYNDPCVERGATIAYDETAATAARQAVAELVAVTLKPVRLPK
ncbi:Alpha/beta hydrolase [Paraburkholderia piptadeniae]|uniref:Alpha/beta hydrolase n=2 Tax=Paraburkholderia piptadeniae TaxID=1701573 RepID=A0A1N7SKH3_9BURK|nr:Alpha/beta hydrolase [Paraburkholderia piptadeniae]